MSKNKKPAVEPTYPKLTALWKVDAKAMTFEEAKKHLGWREDTPEEKFTDFDLELPNGRRVVFDYNTKNRPWHGTQLKVLKQEHLNRNWKVNPDGIGIGMYGSIMSGQHRLRSFCEAEIERQENPEKWGEEPLTMPCVLVLGLDESDETFRILNTGAPATASDAFYRQGLFPKQTKGNRAKLCTILEKAVRTLLVRTGVGKDIVACNSEIVDFYEKHPKIAECVVHIFEEYGSGSGHAQRVGWGSAAALMWLMGCCATSEDKRAKYRAKPSDKALDWSFMNKAADFWTLLCKGEGEFSVVRDVLDSLCSDDEPLSGLYERKCVAIRAWNLFRNDSTITADLIKPSDTHPDLGGIDCNEGVGAEESEDGDAPVTEAEVEQRLEEVREEKSGGGSEPTEDDKDRKIITALRAEHRNKILLVRGDTGKELLLWEEDAEYAAKLFPKLTVKTFINGMKYVGWPVKKEAELLTKLKSMKKKAVFVTIDGDNATTCEEVS